MTTIEIIREYNPLQDEGPSMPITEVNEVQYITMNPDTIFMEAMRNMK